MVQDAGTPPLSRSHELSDDALMAAVASDDEWALGELERRHRQYAYNFLCAQTQRFEAAEDALCLTWARLWEARRAYDVGRPFRPWFHGILVNAARDARRFDRRLLGWFTRSGRTGPVVLFVDESLDPADRSAVDPGSAWFLQRALARLSFADREVLLLRAQGCSETEIAFALDLLPSAAKMRLARARLRLRRLLDES